MKKLLLIIVLQLIAVSFSAQNSIDYTTYDLIAKTGDVKVLGKDNDYRMVVGSFKKPKILFLLGYTKEQAAQYFYRLLEITGNDKYSKNNRQINFCGIGLHFTAKGTGDKERYYFAKDGERIGFNLSRSEIELFRKALE